MADHPPVVIVDEQDNPIGVASMEEAQAKGLFHRVATVIVESPTGNEILLQKRSETARTYPGCWDVSAAGHVDAGEDYDIAARRELKEELGLDQLKLKEVGKIKNKDVYNGRKLYRFNKVYKTTIPKNQPLKLQRAELSATSWVSINTLKRQIAECPEQFAKGLALALENFYT